MTKRTLVFLADGFEEIEALTVVDYLRRAGVEVQTVSVHDRDVVKGAHAISVVADVLLSGLDQEAVYDAMVLPGGLPGAHHLRDDERVIELIQAQAGAGRLVAAICAAPIVLEKAGLTQGKEGTSYPGFEGELSFDAYSQAITVSDGNLITARGPAAAVYFALEIIAYLLGTEAAEKIKGDILLHLVEKALG